VLVGPVLQGDLSEVSHGTARWAIVARDPVPFESGIGLVGGIGTVLSKIPVIIASQDERNNVFMI
jgi:hypothetical protein